LEIHVLRICCSIARFQSIWQEELETGLLDHLSHLKRVSVILGENDEEFSFSFNAHIFASLLLVFGPSVGLDATIPSRFDHLHWFGPVASDLHLFRFAFSAI
jgi:hypothetical protein